MEQIEISATEFKAQCLRLLDQAGRGATIVITKHGRPVARLTGFAPEQKSLRGSWAGVAEITGDIVNLNTADEWESAAD